MVEDYIKRSDAIDYIEDFVLMNKYYHPYSKRTTIPIAEAIARINETPSADVAEVVGGEWKNKGNFEDLNPTNFEMYECSVCREWLSVGEVSFDYFKNHYKYCPMCGARMDGGT